ncbi:MAG: XRE family transcriptional regulator [Alphaproteobacteria bacterium]|nr:MAG: XRE family transcriptional regulator [Alphaproteobacteria bacterium]
MQPLKSAHPVDIHVGQRLKMFRLRSGYTQQQLGSQVDLTFQQIQKYEKGANRMGASRLYQFSEILHIKPHDFFAGYDVADKSEQSVPQDVQKMFRIFNRIKSETYRKSLIEIGKSLLVIEKGSVS